jgi:hypothetical protein
MNLKKILSLSLALVALATVAVLTGTGTVGASPHLSSLIAAPPPPSVPVNVVNTPLAVTGSVSASITNAALPVTGTVAVSSVPAVTLNGTSAVSLTNNEFSPIFVEPAAAAANAPYGSVCQSSGMLSPYQSGGNDCFSFFGVPANNRLVVEHVSASFQVPLGTIVQNAYVGTWEGAVGGTVPVAYLVPTKVASDAASDYYVASSPVRTYFTFAPSYPLGGIACGITTTPNGANTPFLLRCVVAGHEVPGS